MAFSQARIVTLVFIISFGNVAVSAPYGWQESYTADGELRQKYERIEPIDQSIIPARKQAFVESVLRWPENRGKISIASKPILLSETEQALIRQGLLQIVRTLSALYIDHFAGNREYAKQNILPESQMQNILSRFGYADIGYGDSSRLSFVPKGGQFGMHVGLDLHRTAEGSVLIEINVSSRMGGLTYTADNYNAFMAAFPEYRPLARPEQSPEAIFAALGNMLRKEAGPNSVPLVVQLENSLNLTTNNWREHEHAREYFQAAGIPSVTLGPNYKNAWPRLIYRSEGLFLADGIGGEKRVGYIFQDFANEDYWRLPELADLRAALANNLARSNMSLGAEFLGDKELLQMLPQLARHYLDEDLVIKIPESISFAKLETGRINEDLLRQTLADLDGYVIKRTKSTGSSKVWFGASLKLNPAKLAMVLDRLRAEPGLYVRQRLVPPSQKDGLAIDIRPLAWVQENCLYVSPLFWSRAGRIGTSLSQYSHEYVVLMEPQVQITPPKVENKCAYALKHRSPELQTE